MIHKTILWTVFSDDNDLEGYPTNFSFIEIDPYELSAMSIITRSDNPEELLHRVIDEGVPHSGDNIKFYYSDGEYLAVSEYDNNF
ncbi:hypothetical protein [Enterococcus sp. AZ103]|uniref:hypothetical protein n=1 Tax=Enterococcus sp. AZ103 TaxID=2774628 RepID=UPI003F2766EF